MNESLIEDRIDKFLGYGNLNSDLWFIGMEEGFGGSPKDLEKRFKTTNDKKVIDIQKIAAVDHKQWFEPNSKKIQPTWNRLIQIILTLSKEKTNIEKRKEYQRNHFAREDSKHCVLEFMPLPSKKSTGDWIYDRYGINYLESKKKCLKEISPKRIKLFKELIEKHKPKIVIFYGETYKKYFEKIIKGSFKKTNDIHFYKGNKTLFILIPHSNKRGLTNKNWVDIINKIKKMSPNITI